MLPDYLGTRLRHGDIVGVMATSYCPAFVGRIDRIHWDIDPVWLSLIDVDTGEWRSAQLQHVVGRLENNDPAPRATPEPTPAPRPHEDPQGMGVVFAD